jgi:hypothetical protein
MIASNPARKSITRRTREEKVPRSPLPNNAPAMHRTPNAIETILTIRATVGIYAQMGSGSRHWKGQ